MEPSNYLRRFFLFLLLLFAFVNETTCGNDNEPGLKFTNLPAAKVSGLRGKSLQLHCNGQDTVNKNEQLKYEWLFNGNPINDNDFRFIRKSNGTILEVRKLYIVIKNASKSTGKFNCLLSNSIGSILSRNIFLISTTRSTKSSNKKNEVYKKVTIGENIRLLCPALSLTSDVWFSWLFNNEPLQETRTAYTLINSSVLHIISASKSNEGTYTCIAHNQNVTTTMRSHLRVTNAEDDFKFINFLSENKTVTNSVNGQIVTLECLINLAKPDALIHWKRLSNRLFYISNAKDSGNELTASIVNKRKASKKRLTSNHLNDFDQDEKDNLIDDNSSIHKHYSIVGESSLQIENVNQNDEDDYICTAMYTLDEFNITDFTTHRLNVFDPPLQVKPVKETKIEAFVSKKAKFDCGLIYLPKSSSTSIANKPTIRWLKNGMPIETTTTNRVFTKKDLKEHLTDEDHERDEYFFGNKRMKLDDLVSSQLVISSTIRSDTGYYQCFIESQYESITNEFYLYVNPINNQPLPPKNLMVNVIGSSEAIVNWSIPMSLSEILGYTVHYQSVSNKMKIKEEKAVTNNNFYHLTNLSPYTNYSLFVRAYSQQNASNDSKIITFLTGEETPVDLPFFRATAKNKTSVLLTWEELSSVEARGKILYYKIQYAEVQNANEDIRPELIKTINVESEANEYLITNLKPGKIYRFKVIAGNSKGLPSDDIIEYVDYEQIEMPLINRDQIKINLNVSSLTHDSIKVDWKIEEENNEKDITHLIKNIKLICQNTYKDEDRQVFELKQDQNTFEFVDLYENSNYMIEIDVQFEKGGLLFNKTFVKTKNSIPKLLPEPTLDNDLDIDAVTSSSTSDVINLPNLSDFSSSNTSSTTSTTPEPISKSSTESESNSSSSTTESINRADIDFDPNNEELNLISSINFTDNKKLVNEKKNINENQFDVNKNENNKIDTNTNDTTSTVSSNELPSSFNLSENLLDDIRPNKKLIENDLNLFEKKTIYEDILEQNNKRLMNDTNFDKTRDEEEIQRTLLIDSKILNKFKNLTDQEQTKNEFNKNDKVNEMKINENSHVISINNISVNSVNSDKSTSFSNITEKKLIEKPVTSNEVITDKINEKPVNELIKKDEESTDNQNSNNSIDQINEFKKPFLKRLDKEIVHNVIDNNDNEQFNKDIKDINSDLDKDTNKDATNQTSNDNQIFDNDLNKHENKNNSFKTDLITDLIKEEDKLINNLNQQDNQMKSKFDLFDMTNNQTNNISINSTESNLFSNLSFTINSLPSIIPSTTTQSSSTAQELDESINIQNRINQILKRNLTKDDLLPNINEFEVQPLNGSTVNCKWSTNSIDKNATFSIFYNPVRYLETNYSKNFNYDDEFLFTRTTGNEVNITNLLPYTIYDFYITLNYKSNDQDEDFFYQLNKFLVKKLKNKFYVKHKIAFNQTEKLGKLQGLTKTQKKYEKQFRILESVIDEFENLISFFKGQRKRIRTLEDLPSSPIEFTGIPLDSSSIQLSWRLPIEQNGIINGFEIYYTGNDQQDLPINEWSNVNLNGDQFVHIVKSLNASTEYKFIIRAKNNAGLGKSSGKLVICTLKNNYDTYEKQFGSKLLTSEPDLIDTNTFRIKYEDMSYKDILSLNDSNEILMRIGIGILVLFICISVMAVCNKVCTPVPKCKCNQHPKGNCSIQMNGKVSRKNKKSSYLNGLSVPLSNSNQNVLIYSRQSSNNNIDSPSSVESNSNRHNINITANVQHQVFKNQPVANNRSNVQVEVHSPSEQQEDTAQQTVNKSVNNQEINMKHLTYTKNQQQKITKDEITQLNGLNEEQLTSSEENSLNDQNLNCQLQTRKKNSITQSNSQIEETELHEKSKYSIRRYNEKDKELNLPLLSQKTYHEYDQPMNLVPIIYDQSINCHHLLNDSYSHSLNRVRKASCNCKTMNGFNRNNCNNIQNNEDANDELINERRSLV